MHTALLAFLFIGPGASAPVDPAPEHMTVVVHTTDARRTVRRCLRIQNAPVALPALAEEMEPGRVSWHVSGGRAPYALVRDERDLAGNVCITVRDADGREATGWGVVAEQLQEVYVDCSMGMGGAKSMHATPQGASEAPEVKSGASGAAEARGRIERLRRPEPKEHDLERNGPRDLERHRDHERGPQGGGQEGRPAVRSAAGATRR